MTPKTLLVCLFVLTAQPLVAGSPIETTGAPITGNVHLDFFGMRELSPISPSIQDQLNAVSASGHKSPWLAAGLSIVLPGAGEFYTESYWKSAGFLVAEVALWWLAYYWDHRGDKQTDYFQDYANAHWSVVRYVQYALKNFKPTDPETGQPFTESQFWTTTPDPSHPWVGVNWATINRMETEIGGYYSHNLAAYGDQQYYEMIGKYFQFNMGWDDVDPSMDASYDFQKAHPSSGSLFYMGERAKANSFYDHATTFVTVAICNHILSTIDAALSAGWFNKAHASVGIMNVPGDHGYTSVPVLKVSVEL